MAVSPFKTFVSGEILTASDLNSSITTITNNGISLWSPATGTVDMDGNAIILDADGDTKIIADNDDRIDFDLGTQITAFSILGSGAQVEMQIFSDDATGGSGPNLRLNRDSATAADNDVIGRIVWQGNDDAQASEVYADIRCTILDASAADPDGQLSIFIDTAGTLVEEWRFEVGMYNPNATGAAKGTGTINAKGLFDDGSLVADYVFDQYFLDESTYTKAVQERVDKFNPDWLEVEAYGKFWAEHRRLPDMPDQNDAIDGRVDMSLGGMVTRLLMTCELQAIHIEELRRRTEAVFEELKRRIEVLGRAVGVS